MYARTGVTRTLGMARHVRPDMYDTYARGGTSCTLGTGIATSSFPDRKLEAAEEK